MKGTTNSIPSAIGNIGDLKVNRLVTATGARLALIDSHGRGHRADQVVITGDRVVASLAGQVVLDAPVR